MRKIYLALFVSLVSIFSAPVAEAQSEWLFFDSTHYVSSTQLQYCYHTDLPVGDSVTNLVIVVAEMPYKSPIVKTLQQYSPGCGVYYATELIDELALHKSYAVNLFGTARNNTKEHAPWDEALTVIVPAAEDATAVSDVRNEIAIVNVFPNPSSGTFTIKCSRFEGLTYRIYDVTGRLVFQVAPTSVETEVMLTLGKGIYFLSAAGGGTMQKIVVN